ncbi:MAG TPA: baseplate J/gp47 family protein [Patescibacteria group bacterium]|nr:baseplate J/gp47 family protein [Patescibacteria group bacterium]
MQLPFLKNKKVEKNYFLSLLIKPNKVGAILFEEHGDKLFILASHEDHLETDIDEISSEELLKAADRSISFLESSLPEGATVDKTIFSLPYDWIVENKIKPDYLDRLKTVCKSLGLTPIGYLTSIEAIVHFIEKKEGAPVSAMFIEVTKNHVFAYLVRAGKILEAQSSSVSEGVIETAEELFKKMDSVDVLPAKLVLLDYDNAAQMQQEFISHKWPQSIPFLHVPQVVVLEKGVENEATINGVATQMELEVLSDVRTNSGALVDDEEVILDTATSEEFGFLKEKDIAIEAAPEMDEKEDAFEESLKNTEKSDVAKVGDFAGFEEEPNVKYFKETDEDYEPDEEAADEKKALLPVPIDVSAVLSKLKGLKIPSIPTVPSVSGGNFIKSKGIFFAVGAIILIAGFLYFYYNVLLQSQIIIFADKKAVDKSVPISFSKDPTGDNEIKMSVSTEEVKGDESKNATGKKETGDKATGSVTIYNKTEDSKTFLDGSTIVGPNGLEFQLQDDVNIASTSSFSTTLSSASVKVQASKFGKEYNLPSASNFTVKGVSSSDVIAKNSDAITGGTSKTTTVVSDTDLKDLLTLVTQKLEGDAVSKAQSSDSSEVTFPQALSSEVKDKSYTKKSGDEAGTVGLTATIDYNVGTYSKSDLDDYVQKLSKNDVPGSYVFQTQNSKIDITDVKPGSNGDSASATLKINAVFSPQIDTAKLISDVRGKSVNDADKKLRDMTGVTDVVISFKNKIPGLPAMLSANPKNISVEIRN